MSEQNTQLMTKDEIQSALGQTVMSLGVIQNDLKTIFDETKKLRSDVNELKEGEKEHYEEFKALKTKVNDNSFIDLVEYNNLQETKKMRCADLLREPDRFDLFGRFAAQCLREARSNANYLGHYTMKKDYQNLLEWIGSWIPARGGVKGYIIHLDALHDEE